MRTAWLLGLMVANVAMASDRGARADDAAFAAEEDGAYVPAPAQRLWYSNATFARVNPLGLIDNYKLGLRSRLSTKDSVLLQDTYTFVGMNVMATPAYSRIGGYAEAQLLAVLRVFAQVDGVGYYGTFDQVQSFSDRTVRYSDQALSDSGDDAEPMTGWVSTTGGTLRMKVGPIAVRSTAQVTRYDLALGDDGLYFYDQYWDRLAPDGGWMTLNDLDVLYVKGKLRLGLRHTFTDNLDGTGGRFDAALATHRLGPLFAWQFKDHAPGKRFNQPTVFVVAQPWLQHAYRTGDEQPAALPLIAAGFAFNGDLWTSQ